MSAKGIIFERFEGGQSTDRKVGIKHSFAYSQSLDFRKSPSQLSVVPGATREDGGVLKDLIGNEVMTPDGTIYAFGNAGYFYKRTTTRSWSVEATLGSGCFGINYRKDTDGIYLTSNKTVSLYSKVSSTPVMLPDLYGSSFTTYNNTVTAGFNVNCYQINSPNLTTLTTTVNEGNPTKRFFQSDIEPLQKISVYVKTKGTGDWTLTLHDGLNNVLGTKTITNGNLVNNQFNDFAFTGATNAQVRIYVAPNARTYHYHLTSTVADGIVSSLTTNDLSSCDQMIYADRLVQTTNGLHPISRFLQYEIIGNGNYLSVWEPLSDPPTNAEWLRHRLVFPSEYEVCGIAVLNEYAAIACERVPSGANNGQEGVIFWWDGLSPSANYYTIIPEGAPYGIRQYKNVVYYFAGNAEYAIAGANSVPVKIRTLPGTDTEFSGTNSPITIYPYTATVKDGVHLFAFPSSTTNTSINYGVYSWGAVDKNYPETFGYSYLISTGAQNYTAQNNLTIGMVKNFGDLLHISWRDDTNGGYGVDYIDNTSTPAPTAIYESLSYDDGYIAKSKSGLYVEAYYSLPAGSTITLKYKLNNGSWVTDTNSYSSTNLWQGQSNYARFSIDTGNGGRFYECQVGVNIAVTSATTPPIIYMVSLIPDDNKAEVLA